MGGRVGTPAGKRLTHRRTTAVETIPSAVHAAAHFSQEVPAARSRRALSMTGREYRKRGTTSGGNSVSVFLQAAQATLVSRNWRSPSYSWSRLVRRP